MTTETELDYWSWVIGGAGVTTIPRWSADPAPGERVLEEPVPTQLFEALHRLAADLALPISAICLAAHAKVLSVLAGEGVVVAGYAARDLPRAVPCRLLVRPGSWRALIEDAHRSEAEVWAHRHHVSTHDPAMTPVAAGNGPVFDTVIGPVDDGGSVPHPAPLQVVFPEDGPACTLRVRYDTEVIDDDYAARVAGYHLSALRAMAEDVDSLHERHCLLSPQEVTRQLHDFAGPTRPLPERRAHELFEGHVREHPDRVAAVHAGQSMTYAQLDARADQLGRQLLDRGLRPEDVVAVVTERHLDWAASVLAIFKAGGAYLPLEPHFPADRIARVLTRSTCRFVVTEAASATNLGAALDTIDDLQVIALDELPEPSASSEVGAGLGVAVGPDRLAYLYFTSGSTGEPKGAMCEHAGMLNHLFAKIDDLDIGPDDVVAQTAPQCFDISLWQLVAPLVVGGRTHIVEQEAILDVERFVDTLADGGVTVAQVVPSYLDAVLTYLDTHPRALPALRCVSATGEALKPDLVHRWFAASPDVRLVNAYGLTETSDDTNHEVMDVPAAGERVPLGRAVNNVRVYIVDEHLNLVPVGAPGVIAFAGVCVGRGYVNDPVRTAETYLEDPYHPGDRLYRGGDIGRWLPGGKLDFLGRRDHQVKIAGFRIELGEIENVLTRVPGVGDGAVVVAPGRGGQDQLVAFYSGPAPIDPDTVRSRLAKDLPEYMVPRAVQWCRTLPLTANGKIDRAALLASATSADDTKTARADAAQTPTERRLIEVWSPLLGFPPEQIGRADHFFDRGGTSLSAVKMAIALDRAVKPKDVLAHPVLADLAALIDTRAAGAQREPAAAHATT